MSCWGDPSNCPADWKDIYLNGCFNETARQALEDLPDDPDEWDKFIFSEMVYADMMLQFYLGEIPSTPEVYASKTAGLSAGTGPMWGIFTGELKSTHPLVQNFTIESFVKRYKRMLFEDALKKQFEDAEKDGFNTSQARWYLDNVPLCQLPARWCLYTTLPTLCPKLCGCGGDLVNDPRCPQDCPKMPPVLGVNGPWTLEAALDGYGPQEISPGSGLYKYGYPPQFNAAVGALLANAQGQG